MNTWTMHENGETAVSAPIPVIADGDMFAEVQPVWSDEDGVRVSVNWSADVFNGISRLEDMSPSQAAGLAAALVEASAVVGPR